jgi:hypothetical protein
MAMNYFDIIALERIDTRLDYKFAAADQSIQSPDIPPFQFHII